MRVLAYEINNDLQGAMNTMDTLSNSNTNLLIDQLVKIHAMLTRASHRSHLILGAPFLLDNVLPVESDIISLSDSLRGTMEEIRQVWIGLTYHSYSNFQEMQMD